MVKIYKNMGKGGNGEFVIETDSANVDDFRNSLALAIQKVILELDGDLEFTLSGIFASAFPIAFKLAGYKAEDVHESKVLVCGHSKPNDCNLIAESR